MWKSKTWAQNPSLPFTRSVISIPAYTLLLSFLAKLTFIQRLYPLFPLPRIHFPEICVWLPRSLFSHICSYLLRETISGHPN